jgi:hypothetical protein
VTWATPRREGLQVLRGGVRRSPSLRFFSRRVLLSERSLCRSSREAPSGLRDAPAGPRVECSAGERPEAPPRSTRRGFHAPFFVESLVESRFARKNSWPLLRPFFSAMLFAARDLSRALRLCSDRGHPGGQESGERSECHELNRLGSPQRRPSPAVPEIGDDSWPSGWQLSRGARR